MQPLKPSRTTDPAPSRLSFRWQRLWLTPGFRLFVRAGLPMIITGLSAHWYLSQPANMEEIVTTYREARANIEQRPEFMVRLMRIENASDEIAEDIREAAPLDFPVSSFEIDLGDMRATIETLDAVAAADLVIRPGGVLEVSIVERVPAVVWRTRDALELLDGEGHRVADISARTDRTDLPLILGDGADKAVAEALELVAAAGPINPQLRGLVRVGERRWDLVLAGGLRILLPEAGARAALERALVMQEVDALFDRDYAVIDLRDARRPTLRMGEAALRARNARYFPEEPEADRI